MNVKLHSVAIVFLLGTLLGSCQSTSTPELRNPEEAIISEQIWEVVSVDQFKAKMQSGSVQLLDVRTKTEASEGYIAGARNVDISKWKAFEEEISKLDKAKPVLVYCAVGGRSGQAASYLAKHGFTEIYDLKGGINAWVASSGELVK